MLQSMGSQRESDKTELNGGAGRRNRELVFNGDRVSV